MLTALRLALAQISVGSDKQANISKAVSFIDKAKQADADIITLPECFNSPYGTSKFNIHHWYLLLLKLYSKKMKDK